jgi:hypothetical protein
MDGTQNGTVGGGGYPSRSSCRGVLCEMTDHTPCVGAVERNLHEDKQKETNADYGGCFRRVGGRSFVGGTLREWKRDHV